MPTEAQQRAQHRWMYAVFLAALLHDTGKAAHDLRIIYTSAVNMNVLWNPLAGSLLELSAVSYRVDLVCSATRSYAAHRRFPLVLLPKVVPIPALDWLAREGAPLQELAAYLCGEGRDGPLAELVEAGDRESVRRNLLIGSRLESYFLEDFRFRNAGPMPVASAARVLKLGARLLRDFSREQCGTMWSKTRAPGVRH